MQFKPSAGIFVAGLATAVGGGVIASIAMTTTSSEGAGLMGLLGFAAGVAGLVMLCVGAARALAIIDAIPAAFRNLSSGQTPLQQPPAPRPANPQLPPYAPQQPHVAQNQGYNQPPVM